MDSLEIHKRRAQGWTMADGDLEGSDLRSMRAFGSRFSKVTFSRCLLGLADLRQAKFVDVVWDRCRAYGVQAAGTEWTGSTFHDTGLEQASFEESVLRDVTFEGCRATFASFRGATLYNVEFIECDLRGADLDFVEISKTGCAFDRCNLWGARVALGCQFFNAKFDRGSVEMFAALAARSTGNEKLRLAAGSAYERVVHWMDTGETPKDVREVTGVVCTE